MPAPTIVLSVSVYEIVGAALPFAQVALTLTRFDIVKPELGGGIVPAGRTVIACDANGIGSGALFPNADGTLGTQYGVQVFDQYGVQVFPEKPGRMVSASLPAADCQLHAVLHVIPPMSQSDADTAVAAAQQARIAAEAAAAAAQVVSGIAGAVNTVAGIAPSVTAVGGAAAQVTAVGNDLVNVDAVAGDLPNVDAVAADILNVRAVGQDIVNIDLAATHLTDIQAAPGAAQAAADSAAQAASSAAFAAAAGHIYASTAAAIADGTLANNAYFLVVVGGALSAPLYQKVGGVAVDQNFPFPSFLALQISTKIVPSNTAYGEVDQYGWAGLRLDNAGVRRFGALRAERTFQGVLAERVNEVLAVGLRNARYRGRPQLPYDVNIVLRSGQSNSEGADAIPPFARTPVAGVMMMDAVRPRHFLTARYLNGLTPAVEVQYDDGLGNHWGETGLVTLGDMLMQLTALENRSTYREHGKMVVPMCIGRSGSVISAFGTDINTGARSVDYQLFIDNCNAIKAWAVARNKTVGIVAGTWYWGAEGYSSGYTQAFWKSEMLRYFASADADVGLAIFGQPVGSIPWGIQQTFAHGSRGFTNNPYGAEAELQLVQENDRFDIINPEGSAFLEISGVHHSPREQDIKGAEDAMWVHRRAVLKEKWDSLIPTVTRVSATQVRLTVALTPGFRWTAKETGLPTSRRIQPNFTLFVYDNAAPTVSLAQSRQPRITNDEANGVAYIDVFMSANLPALCGIRNGGGTIMGNLVMVPKTNLTEYASTCVINGVAEAVERWMPVIDRPVP